MSLCFTYGSLMCQDIMDAVCGVSLPASDATLTGFQRKCVSGELFPGIVPHSSSQVKGVLYSGLNAEALRRLDNFEGDLYTRKLVDIVSEQGTTLQAYAYVIRPEFNHLLENKSWSFEDFLKTGKTVFMAEYVGFETL